MEIFQIIFSDENSFNKMKYVWLSKNMTFNFHKNCLRILSLTPARQEDYGKCTIFGFFNSMQCMVDKVSIRQGRCLREMAEFNNYWSGRIIFKAFVWFLSENRWGEQLLAWEELGESQRAKAKTMLKLGRRKWPLVENMFLPCLILWSRGEVVKMSPGYSGPNP